jgi:ABC-type branched-subunit amino acid transport system substrate-binding protein
MLSSDKVQIFDSGCVSAGNFAAAGASARAEIPMFLCSILPDRPPERKWTFTNLSPPRFDLDARFRYLQEKTEIRKVGLLHDPTPYANMTKSLAETMAKQYGLTVVAVEAYKADDPDLSIQIGRIKAAGGDAIIKIGLGGSTVVAAKNIIQLGLDRMLLFAAIDDGSIFRPSGELLGERFLFVATAAQIPDSVPEGPQRAPLDEFLKAWRGKYGDRDPVAGARAWDSISIIAKAAEIGGSIEGAAMRDALEKVSDFQGVMTKYHFSPDEHYGVTKNPFVIGVVRNGNFVAK